MLASLLPGLRDVRTPLTVGYLWLLLLWLWFADLLPRNAPSAEGVIHRAFELADIVGPAVTLAAVSFAAYLLGVVGSFSADGRLSALILARLPKYNYDALATESEYEDHVNDIVNKIYAQAKSFSPKQFERLERDLAKATSSTTPQDLLPRLLVANQSLYGEYDRLSAEATFRLNTVAPLLALILTVTLDQQGFAWWLLLLVALPLILAAKGLARRAESITVIQRAVLAGTIEHPTQSILDGFKP